VRARLVDREILAHHRLDHTGAGGDDGLAIERTAQLVYRSGLGHGQPRSIATLGFDLLPARLLTLDFTEVGGIAVIPRRPVGVQGVQQVRERRPGVRL